LGNPACNRPKNWADERDLNVSPKRLTRLLEPPPIGGFKALKSPTNAKVVFKKEGFYTSGKTPEKGAQEKKVPQKGAPKRLGFKKEIPKISKGRTALKRVPTPSKRRALPFKERINDSN